jgi:CIC family chloride channel protein
VGSVVELPETVTCTSTLDQTLNVLDASLTAAIPVLDDDRTQLVGWLTHQRVLSALHQVPADPTAAGAPTVAATTGRPPSRERST